MSDELEDTGTKKPLPVRVTDDTRRRAEQWVAKYRNVLGRSDVFRFIFEMGLRTAEKNGLQIPPPEAPMPQRRRTKQVSVGRE